MCFLSSPKSPDGGPGTETCSKGHAFHRKPLTRFCRETDLNRAPPVGAVYNRPYFAHSRKNARSQTAPTVPNFRVSRQKLTATVTLQTPPPKASLAAINGRFPGFPESAHGCRDKGCGGYAVWPHFRVSWLAALCNAKEKTLPPSGLSSTQMRPRWASTIVLQIARPSPTPCPAIFFPYFT